jgi:hypothetical protein
VATGNQGGTVSQALGASGPGYDVELDGKTYTLLPFTQRDKAGIEAWVRKRAWAEVRAAKDYLTPDEYRQLREDMASSLAGREYALYGPRVQAMLNSVEGMVEMLRLMLAKKHGADATQALAERLLAERGEQVNEGLRALHPDWFDKEDGDPNAGAGKDS